MPTDPVSEGTWRHLVDLPTDVLLRTTDHQGEQIAHIAEQTRLWVSSTWEQSAIGQPFNDVIYDVNDEFYAALFVSAHGWYRLGTSGLRTALELLAQGASYSAIDDDTGYLAWRKSEKSPEFRKSLGRLNGSGLTDLARDSLAVIGRLYGDLSRSTHSNPGLGNLDIWNSNGPVWVSEGFTTFSHDLSDALAASYVMARLALTSFTLPTAAEVLFKSPISRWETLGTQLLADFFTTP